MSATARKSEKSKDLVADAAKRALNDARGDVRDASRMLEHAVRQNRAAAPSSRSTTPASFTKPSASRQRLTRTIGRSATWRSGSCGICGARGEGYHCPPRLILRYTRT